MSDLLPLKPGCKALILNGKCAGQTTTCLHYMGTPPKDVLAAPAYDDCWEIDIRVPWTSPGQKTGVDLYLNIMPARYLMRIDGHKGVALRKHTTETAEPVA
jgi:hypothetical protein